MLFGGWDVAGEKKERLDVLVVERGLCESREQAQRLILAGLVMVNGHAHTKAGQRVDREALLELKAQAPFVSRGGEKLQAAFESFGLQVGGLVCLDVGASTGGFTDCMLQHGAAQVIALDVGTGQLHWSLRQDPRVIVIERFNARYLEAKDLPAIPQFATFDVSFISLTLVMPPVVALLPPGGQMVTLIKPQFEAGRAQVEKGGVVRDPAVRAAVQERIRLFGTGTLGLEWLGVIESPILGPAGNVEFLGWWRKPEKVDA
ncbi:MAG TPA: TlyA family rRNA (cytidine-2'-O)-methyltransferase [Verrucomicrobia bacterium]|nr:TlyA family rRNA (cytidine-2'-O)-methyltransferase [Verrucomicrobiota bacterium]